MEYILLIIAIPLFVNLIACIIGGTLFPYQNTYPKQAWHFNILDWALRPVMKWFFHNKLTHAWHWQRIDPALRGSSGYIYGCWDSKAMLVYTFFDRIKAEAVGWPTCIVIRPLIFSETTWHIAFSTGSNHFERCIIPVHGSVRLLLGPDPVEFHGLTKDGRPLPLFHVATTSRDNKKYSSLPLL